MGISGRAFRKSKTLKEGLKRELYEEIGFKNNFNPIITHYYDEVHYINGIFIHELEISFIIKVKKEKVKVILSDEHCDYKWVTKDSELLDNFIKDKLLNV